MICATRDKNIDTGTMETSVLCVDINKDNIIQSSIRKNGEESFSCSCFDSRKTTEFDTLLYFDGKRSTAFTLHMNEDIYSGRKQFPTPEDSAYISALPIVEPKERRDF